MLKKGQLTSDVGFSPPTLVLRCFLEILDRQAKVFALVDMQIRLVFDMRHDGSGLQRSVSANRDARTRLTAAMSSIVFAL